MAIQIGIIIVETPDDCTSTGLTCLTCPNYDACEHAYDEEDDQ